MGEPDWVAVMPVKPLDRAKTRLRGAPVGVPHRELVLAMLLDTVAAVFAAGPARLLVVSDDPAVAAALTGPGVRVVPDRPAAGLNAAVDHGAALVAGRHGWVVALAADLPALRPDELAGALARAADGAPGPGTGTVPAAGTRTPGRGFVADAAGTGTVLLAAPSGVPLRPRFGPGSAAAHRASGARELGGRWPSLRRDVDTPEDLGRAARLGLGPHTGALYRGVGGRPGGRVPGVTAQA